MMWEKARASGPSSEKLLQEYGIPLKAWAYRQADGKIPARAILWHSSCPAHRAQVPEVASALAFVGPQGPKALEASGVYLDSALLLRSGKRPLAIRLPRGELPTHLKGDQAHFVGEMEGTYFYYSLSPQGVPRIVQAHTPTHSPQKFPCSPEMHKALEAHPSSWGKVPTCRMVWDEQASVFVELGLFWSC